MTSETFPTEPSFTVTPFVKTAGAQYNFGAVVENIDLGNIDGDYSKYCGLDYTDNHVDSNVKALADAIWTHKVVLVKGQQDLSLIKQWELVTRFDPKAPSVHSHGDLKTFNKQGGLLSVRRVNIPPVYHANPNSSGAATFMRFLGQKMSESSERATRVKITSA